MKLIPDPDNPVNFYCAGLFEGEGTIVCSYSIMRSGNQRSRIVLAIGMTNREPLDLFEDIMQVGSTTGPYQYGASKNKPYYRYVVNKFEEVQYVIECMWPWLSLVRKQQYETALTKYKAIRD